MDSEVQENNVHDKFGELLNLLFGASYRSHKTSAKFQDSMLRAMNTVELMVSLQINKQQFTPSSEGELTSNSWIQYIKNQFGFPGVFVTNVQITDMNDKFAIAVARVVVSTSTKEETLELINAFNDSVTRRSYDSAFNKDMEKLLDKAGI